MSSVRNPRRWGLFMQRLRSHASTRSRLLLAATLALALLAALLVSTGAGAATSARQRANAAASFMTGVGDEQTEMFSNPLWTQLHTRVVRYIAPYDAAVRSDSLARARAWIADAEANHEQILVAFYHSEHTPMRLPSTATYERDVQKFVRLFPHVRQYQSWDEANRGYVTGYFVSPSAEMSARYYQALIRVCHGCTAIGLDVLDEYNIGKTLGYISEFKHWIGKLRTVMPRIWGLHNYSDINRFESWRTREIVRALGGQVWLTETGGIVKFGGAFPNNNGSGLKRAARVLRYMFAVAHSVPHVARLYIYDWSGGSSGTRFDAGLTDIHHAPREGYIVVCRALHATHCGVHISLR
jgi:hypothetical protein